MLCSLRHVCVDLCHLAVVGEDAVAAVAGLRQRGIAMPKIQVSSGLELRDPVGSLDALLVFDEARYLHQTCGDGGQRALDLDEVGRRRPEFEAAGRLRTVNAARRCLVMISDGAPMDSATSHHNPEGFLQDHLVQVINGLEKGGTIELRGIGIDLDLDEFYRRSLVLDLTGTLGNREFRALETLFAPNPRIT